MTMLKKLEIINSSAVSKCDTKNEVIGSSVKQIYACGCVFTRHLQKDSMEETHDVELCPEHLKLLIKDVEASLNIETGVLEIFHNQTSILRVELDIDGEDGEDYWNSITVNEQLFDVRLCRSDDDDSYVLFSIPIIDGFMVTDISEQLTLKILDV